MKLVLHKFVCFSPVNLSLFNFKIQSGMLRGLGKNSSSPVLSSAQVAPLNSRYRLFYPNITQDLKQNKPKIELISPNCFLFYYPMWLLRLFVISYSLLDSSTISNKPETWTLSWILPCPTYIQGVTKHCRCYLLTSFLNSHCCPDWCGSVDWASSYKWKRCRFNSRSGHMHGLVACQVRSWGHVRGNWLMFLSLSFSLPSPLSKDK